MKPREMGGVLNVHQGSKERVFKFAKKKLLILFNVKTASIGMNQAAGVEVDAEMILIHNKGGLLLLRLLRMV